MLSHLEVAHSLERAVRRANLPFAVSQGFSPHMKLAFGSALPVGVGGRDELFDLHLTEYVPPETALAALQAASVDDLMCLSAAYVEQSAPAASAAFPFSTYEVRLSEAPGQLTIPNTVSVIRKRKERVLNVQDYLCGPLRVHGDVLRFTLESKPTGSLRPDVLVRACLEGTGAEVLNITRVAQAANFPLGEAVGDS